MATHSISIAWINSKDREDWRATVFEVTESDTIEHTREHTHIHTHYHDLHFMTHLPNMA